MSPNFILLRTYLKWLICVFFSLQIYTDWANYYLERAKSKKKVTDLSADCKDGLLLAEVIEAVTAFKVPDLTKKPKTQQQMVSLKIWFFCGGVEKCLTSQTT